MRAIHLRLATALVFALGALSSRPAAASNRPNLLIYIHAGSPFSLPIAGRGPVAVPVSHPIWYGWSPDGKYLLVEVTSHHPQLCILTSTGKLLRTLPVSLNTVVGFGWDQDRDTVTYSTLVSGHHRIWSLFWTVGTRGDPRLVWPRARPVGAKPVLAGTGLSYYASYGDPALAELKGELLTSEPKLLYSSRRHILVYAKSYGKDATHPWRALDTRTGKHWVLPFGRVGGSLGAGGLFAGGPVDEVAMSRSGLVAGPMGHSIGVVRLRPRATAKLVADGYDPVFSPDGDSLYFVHSRQVSAIHLRLRLKLPAIFRCLHSGSLDLKDCAAGSHPYRRIWSWESVSSGVNQVSIDRVSTTHLGSPAPLFTETGYGLADLNPMPGNSRLIFSQIESDQALWMHRARHARVYARSTRRYRPYINIQSWTIGSPPVLLVQHGRLPAVQP